MLEERCMMEKSRRLRSGEPPILFWDEIRTIAANCGLISANPETQEQADLADRDLDRALDTLHLLGSLTRFKDSGTGLDKVIVRLLTSFSVVRNHPNLMKLENRSWILNF